MAIMMDCKVTLSMSSRKELETELLASLESFDEIESEKKERTRDLTAKLKLVRSGYTSNRRALKNGYEVLPVECVEESSFELNEVRTVRLDTREVVQTRAMRTEERQQAIEFDDDGVVEVKASDTKPKKRLKKAEDAKPGEH